MSLSTNKILLANAATNGAGAFFLPYYLTNGSTTAVTIPGGIYWIMPTGNVTIEFNTNLSGNISNASWTVAVANNTGGLILADGTNVRANVLAGNVSIILYATNGGQNVAGTFNAT